MNFLDRAIGYFNPVTGMKRARARNATRIFEGAAVGRRSSSWKTQHLSENAELMYAIRPLRDRSRDLIRNTPHAARAVDILVSHSVGNGIVPVTTTGNDNVDKKVNALWEAWQEECDVTGQLDFYAMQTLAARSMVESGEVVVRFVDREMDETNSISVPVQLQVLESDYIDQFRDGIYGDTDTLTHGVKLRRSRLGVGLGEFDSFMGLWLFKNHPGELNTIWQLPYISDFIPKADLLHIFKILRPGQVRGVPWLAPILTTARDVSDFLDAVNVKARVEACFSAFITNGEDGVPLMDQSQEGFIQTADWANPQAQISTLEPGMMKELRAGQDIKFASPTSTSQIEPILMNGLMSMAAGIGVTYDQMAGDLRQANYSSLRAGKLDFWRLISQMQKHILIPRLCKPVWRRFISRAILSGALPAAPSNGAYSCDWVVPAKEYIDPKKDADAEKNEVRAGRVTPQSYIAARGGDWRNDLQDFKVFFDKAHELGVVLDIDVALVDQHGRQPPKPPQEGDGSDTEDKTLDDAEDDKDDDKGDD